MVESRYLGCYLNKQTDSKGELNKRMGDVIETWKRLEELWKHTDCGLKFKIIAYDAVTGAKLMYGLESMQLNRTENEKLKVLSEKAIKENKASKQLIVELLKENEKIKLEKEIFKNKILENENKELREKIETKVTEDKVNRFALLLFITILILIAYGITSFVVSVVQASLGRNQ